MTEMTERQKAGLACYKRRAEASRARYEAAQACCLDCLQAMRSDPVEQATYHTQRAKEAERDAQRLKAETLEKTALQLFTGALIIAGLSLLVLAFSLIALLDD